MGRAEAFLLLLLLADGLIIFLHLLHSFSGRFGDLFFSLEEPRGFGESFQYLKLFWLVMSMAFLALRKREWLYASWSLLFAYLFVDDLMELHERLGVVLSGEFGLRSVLGLRPLDFGELVATGAAASVLLLLIGITYIRGSSEAKAVARPLVILLLVLAFVGIVIDTTHVIAVRRFTDSHFLNVLFVVIEDGGEMLVVSLMLWFVLRFAGRQLMTDTA